MTDDKRSSSPRKQELLDGAYRYVLEHGLGDLSLRPLAAAIGSSPRVLLYLFGSKDALIRALLARARADELALLERARQAGQPRDLATTVNIAWQWLVDQSHRPLLALWLEAYARSVSEPDGPWADFARETVDDWLAVLAAVDTPDGRDDDAVARTLALAVLRGALLDLLATGDIDRTTAAIEQHLRLISANIAA